jgi:Polyketide cyclase / dehydrase and lipid transport
MIILTVLWKIVKYALMLLAILIPLVLITALFVSKEMKSDKDVVINKPKAEVYEYVKLLTNQNNYSKWATMDPNMKKTFSGTDGTVGFISAWDGNSEVGKGAQEITAIVADRIDYELRFEKPMKSVNQAYMTTTAITDSSTKVTWGFSGKMNYPLNIMNLFFNADEMVGKDFEFGLKKLKEILEK